tara:strand:- start:1762 stop:1977 length:216 start_codon:yes stop_codon:yes gene_type:complete
MDSQIAVKVKDPMDVGFVITVVDIARVLGKQVHEEYLALVDGEHLDVLVTLVLVVILVEWVQFVSHLTNIL